VLPLQGGKALERKDAFFAPRCEHATNGQSDG